MTLRARCSACDKTYRVPHDREAWSCKACGATLELQTDATAPGARTTERQAARDAASRCCACGATHDAGARFCEDCGADLAGGGRSRGGAPGEQRAAATEMRRAVRRVGFLQAILVLYLLQCFLLTVITGLAVFVAGEPVVLALFISGLLFVLSVLGLILVRRRPFPIALALALIESLSFVLLLAAGGATYWALGWGALRVALMWGATYQAARLTALAREFPDLYQSRRLRGEHLGPRDRAEGESLSTKFKGRRSHTRDRSGLWLAAGGVALAGVVAYFALRPPGLPDPMPSVEGFRAAWNAGDVAAMADYTRADRQAKRRRIFVSAQESYEWGERFPEAVELEVLDESRGELEVVMHTIGGEVPMQFEWQNERWELTSLSFKGVRDWRP